MCLRGDVYYADLDNNIGHVQTGIRPVIVVSNNNYNNFSENVQIVPVTSSVAKIGIVHVIIDTEDEIEVCGLKQISKVNCEQVMTISKEQLKQRIGHTSLDTKKKINEALRTQLSV